MYKKAGAVASLKEGRRRSAAGHEKAAAAPHMRRKPGARPSPRAAGLRRI